VSVCVCVRQTDQIAYVCACGPKSTFMHKYRDVAGVGLSVRAELACMQMEAN